MSSHGTGTHLAIIRPDVVSLQFELDRVTEVLRQCREEKAAVERERDSLTATLSLWKAAVPKQHIVYQRLHLDGPRDLGDEGTHLMYGGPIRFYSQPYVCEYDGRKELSHIMVDDDSLALENESLGMYLVDDEDIILQEDLTVLENERDALRTRAEKAEAERDALQATSDELIDAMQGAAQTILGVKDYNETPAEHLIRFKDLVDELTESLMDVVEQACAIGGGGYDTGAIGAYTDALRLLEKKGRFRIVFDFGRRVLAERVEPVQPQPGGER